ncbi:MAG: hypothetical protein KC503_35220 [Myxococcales bacterium]|nr:hypothetical protein [Myxococcales bacterium]
MLASGPRHETGHRFVDAAGALQAYSVRLDGVLEILLPGRLRCRLREGEQHSEVDAASDDALDLFYRFALPRLMHARGAEVLHASAVRLADGSLLAFCGDSGSGKSTLATAVCQLGHATSSWADDALVWTEDAGAPYSLRLPFRLRLHREAAARLERLGALDDATLDDAIATHVAARAPLRAIVLLDAAAMPADRADAQLARLSPASAFSALLAHAITFDAGDVARRKAMAARYLALADLAPTYRLDVRRDLERLPEVVDLLARGLEI